MDITIRIIEDLLLVDSRSLAEYLDHEHYKLRFDIEHLTRILKTLELPVGDYFQFVLSQYDEMYWITKKGIDLFFSYWEDDFTFQYIKLHKFLHTLMSHIEPEAASTR